MSPKYFIHLCFRISTISSNGNISRIQLFTFPRASPNCPRKSFETKSSEAVSPQQEINISIFTVGADMRKLLKKFSSTGGLKRFQDWKTDRSHVAVIPVLSSEAQDENIPFIRQRATLEGLPVEIQSAILFAIPDIASLRNLTHASPQYHSAYLGQRLEVLQRILFNSIHRDLLCDAFFAISSSKTLTGNIEDRVRRVDTFLSEYKDSRETWTSPEHFDLESASRLAQLQSRVQHATEDFCQSAFSTFSFAGNQADDCRQLSTNETRRLYRAFYRFEIFCNFFRDRRGSPIDGEPSDASRASKNGISELDSTKKSTRFLGLFNPWEVEELACVRDYFCNYYQRVLLKFEPDLRDRRPNLDLSEYGNGSLLTNFFSAASNELTSHRSARREHRISHVARPTILSNIGNVSTGQADPLSLQGSPRGSIFSYRSIESAVRGRILPTLRRRRPRSNPF